MKEVSMNFNKYDYSITICTNKNIYGISKTMMSSYYNIIEKNS